MQASTVFHRKLREKINARLIHVQSQLASGAATSYDDYKYFIGMISGLTETLKLCEEVEAEYE